MFPNKGTPPSCIPILEPLGSSSVTFQCEPAPVEPEPRRVHSCRARPKAADPYDDMSRTQSVRTAREDRWTGNIQQALSGLSPPPSKEDIRRSNLAEGGGFHGADLWRSSLHVTMAALKQPHFESLESSADSCDYTTLEDHSQVVLTRPRRPPAPRRGPGLRTVAVAMGFIFASLLITGLGCVVWTIENRSDSAVADLVLSRIHQGQPMAGDGGLVSRSWAVATRPQPKGSGDHLHYSHLLVVAGKDLWRRPSGNQIWSWLKGARVQVTMTFKNSEISNRTLCDVTMENVCRSSIDVIGIQTVHVTVAPAEHHQMAVVGIISIGEPFEDLAESPPTTHNDTDRDPVHRRSISQGEAVWVGHSRQRITQGGIIELIH